MKLFFFTTIIGLLSLSARADYLGGVNGGGGNIIKHAHNPWFIQNTQEVKFCIEADVSNFGVTNDRLLEVIHQSVDYWQNEFASQPPGLILHSQPLKIATQKFVYSETCDDVDLRLQFGILHGHQVSYIPNLNRTIGVAIRTWYDQRALKGKGFIYLAPGSGPLALKNGHLTKDTWQIENNILLKFALIHELGHVFGAPDFPNGDGPFIMSDNAVELFTKQDKAFENAKYLQQFGIPHFFESAFLNGIDDNLLSCWDGPMDLKESKFFNIQKSSACLYYVKTLNGYSIAVSDYSDVEPPKDSWVEIGKINLGEPVKIHKSTAISMWFPPTQTVFQMDPEDEEDLLGLYYPLHDYIVGKIHKAEYLANGQSKGVPILVETTTDLEAIYALMDGVFENIFE